MTVTPLTSKLIEYEWQFENCKVWTLVSCHEASDELAEYLTQSASELAAQYPTIKQLRVKSASASST